MIEKDYTKIPKISVIIPVYNVEKYLEECLDSVVNQTLKDIEIICVNDGSTDNSLTILNNYAKKDSRFIILNEKNCGAGISRKKAIDISKGEYVFLLDADDILNKNALELTYENAITNNSDLVLFKVRYFDENNYEDIPKKFDLTDYFHEDTNFNNVYFNWNQIKPVVLNKFTCIWNRLYNGDFIRNNDFYFPKKLSYNDIPLHVQSIILAKKISFVPKVLYNYRLDNSNSITITSHSNKKVFDIFNIVNYVEKFIRSMKLYSQLRFELIKLKIDHFIFHLNSIQNGELLDEFFNQVKLEFEKFNLTKEEFNKLEKNFKILFLSVIDSSSFTEFNAKREEYASKPMSYEGFDKDIKVSVIIPVYNVEKYLEECLDSVVNQTLKDIEIICVNDGSTDNSLTILNNYAKKDCRIKIINQNNCGLGCARNSGLNYACGKYISFLDSDDIISLNSFELLYNNAISNESDVVLFKIDWFDENGPVPPTKGFFLEDIFKDVDFNNFTFNYTNIKEYVLNVFFSSCTKLYKKEFLDNYDDFRFPTSTAFEDVPFHVKCMLRASKFSFVPEFLYHYRLSNTSSITHTESNAFDILKICDMVEKFLYESEHFEELKLEFTRFKIIQLSQYIIFSDSSSYFNAVKKEFESLNMDRSKFDKSLLDIYDRVLSNDTYDSYRLPFIKNRFKCDAKISVIVMIHNDEKYLEKCLNSVIHQTFKDIEIICINNGSSDNSLNIIKKLATNDNRIKIINLEHSSISYVINWGLKTASGKYISFIAAEDWISVNLYEKCYSLCESEKLDMVIFNTIDNSTKIKGNEESYINLEDIFNITLFSNMNIQNNSSSSIFNIYNKLYKIEFLNEIEFSSERILNNIPFLFEAILKTNSIYILDEELYNSRFNSNKLMVSDNDSASIIPITNKMIEIILQNGFDNYEQEVINLKIKIIKYIFDNITEKYKSTYFDRMKEDFENIYSDENLFSKFENYLNESMKKFYKTVLNTNTYTEFNNNLIFTNLNEELSFYKDSNRELQEELNSTKINVEEMLTENKLLNNKISDYENKLIDLDEKYKELNYLCSKLKESNLNLLLKIDSIKSENYALKNKINSDKTNTKFLSSFLRLKK